MCIPEEFRQWCHGYVVTSHKAQGWTAGHVVVDSPIHAEAGRLLFNNPGIATACEKHRKGILGLVARLSDKKQAPAFDEAFRFEEAEAFEQKNWLIHQGK